MSWLSTDPATWHVTLASYPQICPDGCSQQIILGQTFITNVGGGWRRYECARRQWEMHNNTYTGTEAEYVAATKRVSELGGTLTGTSWNKDRPRDARYHWVEVVP